MLRTRVSVTLTLMWQTRAMGLLGRLCRIGRFGWCPTLLGWGGILVDRELPAVERETKHELGDQIGLTDQKGQNHAGHRRLRGPRSDVPIKRQEHDSQTPESEVETERLGGMGDHEPQAAQSRQKHAPAILHESGELGVIENDVDQAEKKCDECGSHQHDRQHGSLDRDVASPVIDSSEQPTGEPVHQEVENPGENSQTQESKEESPAHRKEAAETEESPRVG